eukprot:CAMPEP_0179467654 /NCGR_PEP_ID=MMETSP0799-20121207/48715_1 /TAXON_ID=46947 /ORGANISM="Geminigera cryophila, Strain CCMP2564" /LENGTH=73 /DNA_ID=CAMNT_0021273143 /DNA_START=1749 /DNA_END=1971 /DNA_ORIENTATION=-
MKLSMLTTPAANAAPMSSGSRAVQWDNAHRIDNTSRGDKAKLRPSCAHEIRMHPDHQGIVQCDLSAQACPCVQ